MRPGTSICSIVLNVHVFNSLLYTQRAIGGLEPHASGASTVSLRPVSPGTE